jgi:hypothetical protein
MFHPVEQSDLGVGEAFELHPVVDATDRAADGDDDDIRKLMEPCPFHTRLPQGRKMLND